MALDEEGTMDYNGFVFFAQLGMQTEHNTKASALNPANQKLEPVL
jgi:hypothetical protein